jgi:hypothetical protein
MLDLDIVTLAGRRAFLLRWSGLSEGFFAGHVESNPESKYMYELIYRIEQEREVTCSIRDKVHLAG